MSDVKMPMPIKLWEPPNFAIVQGENETQDISVPLAKIPDDVFAQLVDAWVTTIYKKAGKSRPPTAG